MRNRTDKKKSSIPTTSWLWESLFGFLPAALCSAGLCVLIGLSAGAGAMDVVSAIWEGAWGSADATAATITKMTPLVLTGLAVALAYRVNLLNIGCEGQLTLGALSAATATHMAGSLPSWLLPPLGLAMGAAVGGLWAYPAVCLKRKRDVHEVITTLLLNYLAVYLAEYLVLGPLGDGTAMGRTPEIPESARLHPVLQAGAFGITAAPFGAVFLGLALQLWLSRTLWGFEATMTGSNMPAAVASGIGAGRWQGRVFVVSGALAGLAGALEVMTVHHRFYRAFSPGYGFDGIAVAFLVNCVPGMVWLSATLIASLRAADKWLQLALGISPSVILVIEAGLLLAVTCRPGFRVGGWKRGPGDSRKSFVGGP
jgi:ABC-type uncharacterized transport system permease subunit